MSTILEQPSATDQAADFKWLPETNEPESVAAAEQREAPIERLDHKVNAVLNMAHTIEDLRSSPDMDPEKVNGSLDQIWSTAVNLFPPATIERYVRQQEIEQQLNRSYKKLDSYVTDHTMMIDDVQAERVITAKLRNESTKLLADDDVQFLLNIGSVVESLRYKNSLVDDLRHHQEELLFEINNKVRKGKILPTDVVETRWTPFEITLILEPAAYNRLFSQDSYGLHYNRTPFSIVRRKKQMASTIRHEGVHNLTDEAGGIRDHLYVRDRLEEMRSKDKRAISPAERVNIENALISYHPATLLDQMHNELLAELDTWEKKPFGQDTQNWLQRFGERNRPFFYHILGLSTAGMDAYNIKDVYGAVAEKSEDPAAREALLEHRDQFEKKFIQAIRYMQKALVRARSMGGDSVERIKAAMFVLPPSRYRHLDRYLDSLSSSTK